MMIRHDRSIGDTIGMIRKNPVVGYRLRTLYR